MRTARSITSGENFGDFLIMAPFSIEGASSKAGAVQGAAERIPLNGGINDIVAVPPHACQANHPAASTTAMCTSEPRGLRAPLSYRCEGAIRSAS
jgi:hypothetical protein